MAHFGGEFEWLNIRNENQVSSLLYLVCKLKTTKDLFPKKKRLSKDKSLEKMDDFEKWQKWQFLDILQRL